MKRQEERDLYPGTKMRSKGFIIGCVLFLCLAGLAVYVTVLTGNLYRDKEDDQLPEHMEKNITDYISYLVQEGNFILSENVEGRVTFEADAVKEYIIENGDTDGLKVSPGQLVKKNDILYQKGSTTISAESDGRIVTLDTAGNITIQVLDYGKSKIVATVSEKNQSRFDNNTKVYGSTGTDDRKVLQLKGIDPTIGNDGFEISISNPFEVYENTKIDIYIEYGIKEKTVFVPAEYIKRTENGSAYVTTLDADGRESKVYVKTGDESNGNIELTDAGSIVGKEVVWDAREAVINGK